MKLLRGNEGEYLQQNEKNQVHSFILVALLSR